MKVDTFGNFPDLSFLFQLFCFNQDFCSYLIVDRFKSEVSSLKTRTLNVDNLLSAVPNRIRTDAVRFQKCDRAASLCSSLHVFDSIIDFEIDKGDDDKLYFNSIETHRH